MKRISKRDAERIRSHIIKAWSIFSHAEIESDDGEISMDGEQMDSVNEEFKRLQYFVDNTNWD